VTENEAVIVLHNSMIDRTADNNWQAKSLPETAKWLPCPVNFIVRKFMEVGEMGTVFQCCQQGKDVAKTLGVINCEPTEKLAMRWLETNGGGIYRNILHNFQFYVYPKV